MWAHIFWSRDPKHIGLHHKFLKTFRFLDKPRSCVANVGHVGNIFAYRCFLFAVPMLRVCRAAPLKTRFRSQDIITALPMMSWEPPNPRKNDIWLFCLPVNLQCFCSFRFTTQKVQFSQAIARLGGPKDGGGGPSPEVILVLLCEL